MKKIFLVSIGLLFLSSCVDCNYHYIIRDSRGINYYTNYYTVDNNGCISFEDRYGTHMMCGSYNLTINTQWKQQ